MAMHRGKLCEPIAVVGAGRIRRALAQALLMQRYKVRFGVPDPARHVGLAAQFKGRATVGSVSEAIGPTAIVILATPYGAALQVSREVGDWQHRVLVDATNPIAPGMVGLLVGTVSSGAQEIALLARGARVVKDFNSACFENLNDPHHPGSSLFMPVAGDDAEALQKAIALTTLIDSDAIDVGELSAARHAEPWAMLWIETAIRQGHDRGFGFLRSSRV
jgi:8-hydroxy-5-deazaflavin:NADPH oxidoreductase